VPSTKGAHGAKAYVSPAVSKGPAGGFTPADLASAYGYAPTRKVHQTVAVVDAYNDPHALSNLNKFDAHYGLPRETSRSFRKVNQDGHATPLPTTDIGWAGEIALDIETVRAVCNSCKIVLIEARSASGANLAAAVNTAARLGATEISNSYGAPENPHEPASFAAAYKHPGVVITASTGDDGWYDWDLANNGIKGASDNAPNVPAAYPSVVAVGGTALSLRSNGSRQQETIWNENGLDDSVGLTSDGFWGAQGASGGGCSALYAAPAWQVGASGYASTGCGTHRLATDVSALADPFTGFDIFDTYSGGWITAGGTSLASPLVASMWALAGGGHGVRYPARTLYDNLELRAGSVYDVTSGGNSFCGGDSQTGCSAALEAETHPPTGNPNNLVNFNSIYSGGWAGLLDCGFPYDGSNGTIANDAQCNAVAGYDAAGVGTPHGLALFSTTPPSRSNRRRH
jgi:subtilase family serine protease